MNDINRLKLKDGKKYFMQIITKREQRWPHLDKIDKSKMISRDKRAHYVIIKELINQKYIIITNIYAHNINTKLILFLFNINAQSNKIIKKTIVFIIVSEKIKYLGMNLTKELIYLYTKNIKYFLKKSKTTHFN